MFGAAGVLIYNSVQNGGIFLLSLTGGFLIGAGLANLFTIWLDTRFPFSVRMLVECHECHRKIPNDFINALIADGENKNMCALCGLIAMNKAMGLPADAPFTGRLAKQMYKRTLKYYKKTKQL